MESERAAALRRPQSGTPLTELLEESASDELVGDEGLILIGMESAAAAQLCGVLLRTQIQTYKATRHIMALNDEFIRRKIRWCAHYGTLPNYFCRCLRCGAVALLIDWCVMVDTMPGPLRMPGRSVLAGQPTAGDDFWLPCPGNEIADLGLNRLS